MSQFTPDDLRANLATLDARRSVPAKQLGEPGPGRRHAAAHAAIGRARARPRQARAVPLPAHRGDARHALGERLAARGLERDPDAGEAAVEKDRMRFSHAPLVVAVIAKLGPDEKIPEQERLLSAGCVCFALLQAAQALGFGAHWLTGWPAYDAEVARWLGLRRHERIVGFIHIGTPKLDAPERERPDPRDAADRLDAGMSDGTQPRRQANALIWSTPACTCSAPGIRCRTSSTTPTAGRPTPCTASPASCWNCSSAKRPQHIAIAFDEALDSCFRNALYPAYKANRDPAPEELKRQFAHCKALCVALGLTVLAHERVRGRRPDRQRRCMRRARTASAA